MVWEIMKHLTWVIILYSALSADWLSFLYWSQSSETGRGRDLAFFSSVWLISGKKLNFNFQFRTYFPQRLVKGICQTLHVIQWAAQARFRPKRTNLVEETNCFFSLVHQWPLIMTRISLRLSPTTFPVKSRLLNLFTSILSESALTGTEAE